MESGESFVNVYLRLQLTCHLVLACCSCRLYLLQISVISLHSSSPAGFVYLEFSWTHDPFVFSSIQPYSPVAIAVLFYFQFGSGGAPPPFSGGVCHTLATVGCLLLSKHTEGGGATPTFSDWLVYLQFIWGSAPPLLSRAQGTLPSLLCVFFFYLLVYYKVFFSPLGRGQSVQGAMVICPRDYHVPLICSPGGLPSRVGASIWWHGSPPGFSI
jgi:hypothetical protein